MKATSTQYSEIWRKHKKSIDPACGTFSLGWGCSIGALRDNSKGHIWQCSCQGRWDTCSRSWFFSLALHQCNAYLGHLGRECQLCVQRRRHLWKQEHPRCGLAKEYDQRRPVCPNWSKPSIRGACAKSLAEPCALVICLPPMKTFRGSRAACCVQQAHLYSWIPIIERWLLKKRPILYHSHCGKRLVSTFVKKQWSAAKVAQWTDCKYEHQPTDRPRQPWPKHKFQDGSAAACGSSLILFPKPVKHLLTTNLKCWSCWSVEWTVLPCKCKSWTWKFASLGLVSTQLESGEASSPPAIFPFVILESLRNM